MGTRIQMSDCNVRKYQSQDIEVAAEFSAQKGVAAGEGGAQGEKSLSKEQGRAAKEMSLEHKRLGGADQYVKPKSFDVTAWTKSLNIQNMEPISLRLKEYEALLNADPEISKEKRDAVKRAVDEKLKCHFKNESVQLAVSSDCPEDPKEDLEDVLTDNGLRTSARGWALTLVFFMAVLRSL